MNPFVPLIALYCTLSDLPRRECSAVSADALLDIQGRVWKEFLWNPKWTRFDQLTRSNFGNFSSGSPTSMNSSLKTHVIVQVSSQTPVSSIWRWIAHQHLPLEMIDKHKVNRCLARCSPHATTTNRLTNRALNKPAWPCQIDQKCQFWAKFGRFWAKNPFLYWRNQKFCYPHNGKPT